jgi:hypothetical protein
VTPSGARLLRIAGRAATTVLAGALAAPADAQDQPDDWYYRQPAPTLPEQLNTIIRPLPEDRRPPRIERIRDVFLLIGSCWRWQPSTLGHSGQELTVRMSFNARGELIGKPRITYYKRAGDREARDAFVNSIKSALQRCTPLPFSERFGAAIAGRPFTFRFVDASST